MNWEAFIVALAETEREELARMLAKMGYPKIADQTEIDIALAHPDARDRERAIGEMVRNGRLYPKAAGELIARGNVRHAYEPKAGVHDLR